MNNILPTTNEKNASNIDYNGVRHMHDMRETQKVCENWH